MGNCLVDKDLKKIQWIVSMNWYGTKKNLSCVNKAWLNSWKQNTTWTMNSSHHETNWTKHVDSYAFLTNWKIICCKRNSIPEYLFHSIAWLHVTSSHQNRFPHMSVRAVSRRRQPFTRRGQVLSRPGDFICSPLGRADISYGGEPTHKNR